MIERVTTIALNIETRTPMIRTRAKPRMTDEPKAYRIVAVMRLDTFESRMEFQARLKPASTAAGSDLPTRSSSFIRSKIRMLASTAMPTESTKPAMPARVRVTGMSRKIAYDHDRVVDEREGRDDARQPVVQDHEGHDQGDADEAGQQGLVEELLAERGRDLLARDLRDRERQRAELEDGDELVGLLGREAADAAAGDLDRSRRGSALLIDGAPR